MNIRPDEIKQSSFDKRLDMLCNLLGGKYLIQGVDYSMLSILKL